MKKTLSIIPIIALSVVSYAETWSYDAVNTENNTKESLGITSGTEYKIDTTNGDLTITKNFANYGDLTITGANLFTAAPASDGNNHYYFQNRGKLTINNANIKVGSGGFKNENTGSTLIIQGINTISASLESKGKTTLTFESGSVTKINQIAAKDTTVNFNNLGPKGIFVNGTFTFSTDAIVNFNLGNNALACVDKNTAMLAGYYVKAMNGTVTLSLKDFKLSENFVIGETYEIVLMNDFYGQDQCTLWDEKINNGTIINGEFAKFVENSAVYDTKTDLLTIKVQAVPEPSTYAAIFGALALAFVAYRRRK